MICWLASYPRSGNTFLRVILAQVYGFETTSVYEENWSSRIRELLGPVRDFELEKLRDDDELFFVKTHEMPADDDFPAIHLVRDGRDVLVSYANYILTKDPELQRESVDRDPASVTQVMRDLVAYEASFGGWGPNVEAWFDRKPSTALVRFEDLIRDPVSATAGALESLGLDPTGDRGAEPLPSFEDLHRIAPEFFRRGKVGDFRGQVPPDLQLLFWQKYGALMNRLGYRFWKTGGQPASGESDADLLAERVSFFDFYAARGLDRLRAAIGEAKARLEVPRAEKEESREPSQELRRLEALEITLRRVEDELTARLEEELEERTQAHGRLEALIGAKQDELAARLEKELEERAKAQARLEALIGAKQDELSARLVEGLADRVTAQNHFEALIGAKQDELSARLEEGLADRLTAQSRLEALVSAKKNATETALKAEQRLQEKLQALLGSLHEQLQETKRELAGRNLEEGELRHELEVKEALIGDLGREVRYAEKKEELIHELDQELKVRMEVIEEQLAGIEARDDALEEMDSRLRRAEDKVATMGEKLVVREQEIESLSRVAEKELSEAETRAADARERAMVELDRELEEARVKERVIQALDRELKDRMEVIEEQTVGIAAKDRALEDLDSRLAEVGSRANTLEEELETRKRQIEALTATIQESTAQALTKEIEAKEEHLQRLDRFRRTSLTYWLEAAAHKLGIGRFLGFRRWFRPRLGVLQQHPPVPLRLPATVRPAMDDRDFPSMSIVTPSLNQARFLERTIRSVVDQDYPELEYVVQDGGSEDESPEMLERLAPMLHAAVVEPDEGQADALNRGFAKTTGEIMAYLNSDDLLLPGSLHYVGAYFSAHPEVDVVYGHRVLIDEEDLEIGRWVLPPHRSEALSWADYIPQETLFWRRELWERAGGLIDDSFKFAMDWDLLLRLSEAGAKFRRLPRFLGAFRIHGSQKTSSQIGSLGDAEMDLLRKRVHDREVTREEIERGIRPYMRRHILLHNLWRAGLLRY
ncbi:MAG: glycosyltransferase [Thermoanaerobaculia bacterium]